MIFPHQNLISNWLTYLVHAKSIDELISFGSSDRSVRSLVSAKRSANRQDQTKKGLYFLADLWSQSEFRTQQNAERKTDPKSAMTHCGGWQTRMLPPCISLESATSVAWELRATKPKRLSCIAARHFTVTLVHYTTWLSALRTALEVRTVNNDCIAVSSRTVKL